MLTTQTSESESGSLAPIKNSRHISATPALGKQYQDPSQPRETMSSGLRKRPYLKTKENNN